MNTCRRSIFFIDRKVQGALVLRTVIYWLFCLFSVALMLICWRALTGPLQPFRVMAADVYHQHGAVLLASLILLPISAMDVLRLSNRFVGPVARMRAALAELAAGRSIEPVHFLDDDYWRDLAGNLNEVAARLKQSDSRS
jgi:hypothetical protein